MTDGPIDISSLLEGEEFCSGSKQDQEKGESSESDCVEARPFHGADKFGPAYVLQKEEPQHRVICYLAAEGNTTTEISEKTGYTTACIAYVKKQSWAQRLIAEIQSKSGGKAVKEALSGKALEAAQTLIEAMQGRVEGIRAADRIKAANDILNRLYGTAPQLVMHGKVDAQDLSDEELAAAIAAGKN
jgi:hypothetical protein